MKKKIGLWIDHRKAVVVIIQDGEEEIREILSNVDKRTRYKSSRDLENRTGEDVRDRRYENQLNRFYDEVIDVIRDADSLRIFGPGEAKGELVKRIGQEGLKASILPIETVDKMTNRQISSRVRELFLA